MQAAAFVTVVWAVAASFVAFEVASLWGMGVAMSHPGVLGDLALSPAVVNSTTCDVKADEQLPASRSSLTETQARAGSWSLGLRAGWDAKLREYGTTDPQALEKSQAVVDQFAGLLGVPAPGAFRTERLALSNRAFVSWIEGDGHGTAHRLAVTYSTNACRLYKLGAVWGYEAIVRNFVPGEFPIFASETRFYARQIGLPEPLWIPMTERTDTHASSDALVAESQALTNAVTQYLMSQ